jgi:hypothetical protein
MKYLFLFFFSLPLLVLAQTKVYTGQLKSPNELIFEYRSNTVYRVNNAVLKSEYLFVDGEKVYFRDRKFNTDVKYTIKSDVIYKGSSTSTFDVLFTLKDQKLYIGRSTFRTDCLYTFKDGVVYRGDSSSSFDAFMSYELADPADLIYVAMMIAPY